VVVCLGTNSSDQVLAIDDICKIDELKTGVADGISLTNHVHGTSKIICSDGYIKSGDADCEFTAEVITDTVSLFSTAEDCRSASTGPVPYDQTFSAAANEVAIPLGNADVLSSRVWMDEKDCDETGVKVPVVSVSGRTKTTGRKLNDDILCIGGVADVNAGDQLEVVDVDETYTDEWSLESFAREQKADEEINIVLQLKKLDGVKPTWDQIVSESPLTKALWHQWDRLVVKGSVLYRSFLTLDGRSCKLQLVVPIKMRRIVFSLVHEGITGGHMGRKRTELQMQSRAYWPGWTADIRRFMHMCTPCSRYHRGGPPKSACLKPLPVGDFWERISIDITGPHPRSKHGNVFLLTVMDNFTKWADALPIPNHTAVTVARVLFNRVFVYMGMPLQLLSDQGPEFEKFQEFCRWMDIEKLRTTPYKPSTNGMIERYHRSLNSIIAKIICENQKDWCEKAPIATAAYRASVHEATGYSPNFLVFMRENRAPVDLVLGCPPGEDNSQFSSDKYVERQQETIRDVCICSSTSWCSCKSSQRVL